MKTLLFVKNRIDEIQGKIPSFEPVNSLFPEIAPPTKEQKKMAKELKLLNWVKMLLEFNPNPVYINSELKRLLAFVKSKEDQFRYFWANNKNEMEMDEARTKYRKISGITEANGQIKMLRYILEDGDKSKKAKK